MAAKEKKERIEEQPDVDIIICNFEDPETGEILHSNVSSAGSGCQREENMDRGTTRCRYYMAMYLLQGVAAKEKEERLEEQPDAAIIICNVVDPETGEILHSNVSSAGSGRQREEKRIDEQPDADIIICNVVDPDRIIDPNLFTNPIINNKQCGKVVIII